jgi:outer membrane lipoprotein carrier protein
MRVTSLLLLLSVGAAIAAPADSLWQNLRRRYTSLKTLSGTFEERICSEAAGTCQDFSGRFSIRVPSRYRLEVTDPVRQLLVSDSTSLWIYLPDEKRVLKQPAGGFAPVLAFLGPVLDSTATADVYRDSTGNYVADVHMDEELSAMAGLRLELDATATKIKAFSFSDAWGAQYHFTLSDQNWNPRLAPKLFRFTPPKGVTVEE